MSAWRARLSAVNAQQNIGKHKGLKPDKYMLTY